MRLAAAALLLAALAGPAGTQIPAQKRINFYSLAKEKQLGQAYATQLESALPMAHDPRLEFYVAQLGATVASFADSRFDYTFRLYEDRRPGQTQPALPLAGGCIMPADAFQGQASEPVVVPGGTIFVPLSLLAAAPNEAVFAFQLAHAVAHIASRHGTWLATRMELMQISDQVRLAASPGGAPFDTFNLPALSFLRAAEREADFLAVQFMAKAGYDAQPVADYLGTQPKPPEPRPFGVRPTPAGRAKAIRDEIATLQPPPVARPQTGAFAEARALAAAIR
jgi:predicted Zn-dependent protease